ncbi:glycosyltransferase family 2 protein [Radiobacillus deserti]|uniref:Glycosyltransferase family 2 protein n=1 Tax=Radiobacillus deserti TaxID=2594883 RepID=A0A516KLH7_9BACI|nr:glycosyltransferase family 2 protein [Radiobacillus deserti]QDP42227.1 glycosyltransferase family 2 protein [Radiobacillus deserti]
MVLVSIIMPAYNCETYIRDSIQSVLKQTYTNWELIIIDDGSMDGTISIIEEYSQVDDRVYFYNNERNQGVSATRNRGIELAKGEWIAFLDSDDLWDSLKLEKQLAYADKTGASFLFTGSAYIDENNRKYSGVFEVPRRVNYKSLLKQNVISCSSVLIKRDYIKQCKMENDETHEDYGAWIRILKMEQYAYGLNEPLLTYRILKNSKSGNKIKSLIMAYKTYRYVGINTIMSMYYITWYIFKGLKKYHYIKNG